MAQGAAAAGAGLISVLHALPSLRDSICFSSLYLGLTSQAITYRRFATENVGKPKPQRSLIAIRVVLHPGQSTSPRLRLGSIPVAALML